MLGFDHRKLLDIVVAAVGNQRVLVLSRLERRGFVRACQQISTSLATPRTTGCSLVRPSSFITAGPGPRIPQPVRVCLQSFCRLRQINSFGPSNYASEA